METNGSHKSYLDGSLEGQNGAFPVRGGSFGGGRLPPLGEVTDNQLRLLELVNNWDGFSGLLSRADMMRKFQDPRRDLEAECGWPKNTEIVDAQKYQELYDREPIATRVVQLMPKECWQQHPDVFESDDADEITEFEEAWDELPSTLNGDSFYAGEEGNPIWEYLYRVDKLSGIGTFGVLVLALDDGKLFEDPVDGMPPDGTPRDITGVSGLSKDIYGGVSYEAPLGLVGTDAQYFQTQFSPSGPPKKKTGKPKLLFIRAFAETLCQVVQYEASIQNPRFGQPIMYLIQFNDPRQPHTGVGLPMASVRVHWTRVLHIADNLESSEVFGVPRMRPVLNPILDQQKVRGGGSEGYWRSCINILSLETHPQLGGDVLLDRVGLRNMLENVYGGMQRDLLLSGLTAKTVAPTVVDPTPHIDKAIECICIVLECPVRVFKGAERGELASSQDDADWNGRVHGRRITYLTPKVIRPFIDRLIKIGVLPEPPEGYQVKWPEPENMNQKDKAQVTLVLTQALAAFISGNVEQLIEPLNYLTRVFNWSEEVAMEVMKETAKHVEDKQDEAQDMADEHGFEPAPPEGFQQPEPEPPPQPPIKVKDGEKLVQPPGSKPPSNKPPSNKPPSNLPPKA